VTENTHGNGDGKQARPFPWELGSATGIGSMPGTDPAEANRIIVDELPGFPFLPELPARGPGADLIGRTAALLIDLPVETTTGGWRIAERPGGRYMRAAQSMLSSDLDAMEEQLAGYEGPLKISLAGPWTLAATIELPKTLQPLLSDDGAVADLTASLAEAAAAHVAEVAKRVPGAKLVVQIDEPSLAAVAYGEVPTASGLSRIPAPDVAVMSDRLQTILTATGQYSAVHCCAGPVPFDIIMTARPDAISFDLSLVRREDGDLIAEMAEAGRGIFAGAVRTILPRNSRDDPPAQTARRLLRFWRALGMNASQAAQQIVVTPACGLAGATPARAAEALAHCREAARIVPELAEETTGDEE
jgi:methionine synthase II (cobalamin-independent)